MFPSWVGYPGRHSEEVMIAEVSNPVEQQHPKDGAVLVIQAIGISWHLGCVCVS